MKKWNHYTCDTCGKVTVARHDDEGVTPFIVGCHASDKVSEHARARTCKGFAQSCFFECDQSEGQVPHVIFYRPKKPDDAIAAINREPKTGREWLLEHYLKGGALMRFPDMIENLRKGAE